MVDAGIARVSNQEITVLIVYRQGLIVARIYVYPLFLLGVIYIQISPCHQ
jgi:hypothetical protein